MSTRHFCVCSENTFCFPCTGHASGGGKEGQAAGEEGKGRNWVKSAILCIINFNDYSKRQTAANLENA